MDQEKKLFPYFQPIVCAANGNIVGYEALARQYDANGRVISAGALFSSADIPHHQLIEWDRIVRRQALQQFSAFNNSCYLTINISATWLDYISDFNALPTMLMIDEFGIDRSRIVIEITESEGDIDKLVKAVEIYRKNGIKVAIDDFGSGFSQLERVMTILPDIIKLDMTLFQKAAKGGIASDVVHMLTRLARRTGCRIVCEGVETADEFFFGLNCGAQYMQGYLFSPAVATFQDSTHYQQEIATLRKQFLQTTLGRERDKIQFILAIKGLIEQLKCALEDDFVLAQLPTDMFYDSGVLRFYLCNNEGDQISSNYNLIDGKWVDDSEKLGFNWSWRAYFYQLRALEATDDCYRIVTSDRYRDFSSDLLCKTLSLRLDDERILLVDIAAEWL
ncbi:MAG: EAL domain-containing protein [Methylovulum sp.]|nr:EAL domain-containing protein [Methylovulum sp.]